MRSAPLYAIDSPQKPIRPNKERKDTMTKLRFAFLCIVAGGIAFTGITPSVHAQGRVRSRLQQILGRDRTSFYEPDAANQAALSNDPKQIAQEAFIYGFPMVMGYGIMYEYAVDTKSDQYKAPFNKIYNTARVYTPKDTAVITPNSDTPYSFIWADLRAEPIVLSVPEVEKGRYYSVM